MSKNNENKLVPRLRFPEFKDVGAWAVEEVGNVFEVTRGYVLSMNLVSEEQSESNPFPVYSSQTKNNGLAGYYKDFLYEDAITWTTDGANAGDVNFRKGKFYCTNVCGVLINKNGFSNLCIASLINSVSRKHVSYIGNPKLMNGVMSKIKIPFPKIKEQQKIASCLSSLDEIITTESQKLEMLKEHKKGLLQNLLPQIGETVPKFRFKEFEDSGEWEEMTLGEICKVTSGGTPSRTNNDYWNGDIPWISTTLIDFNTINSANEYITEAGLQNSSAKIFPNNTILMAMYGQGKTRGKVAILGIEAATNQACAAILLKDGYNTNYVFQNLAGRYNEIRKLSNQGGQENLSGGLIENISITIPVNPKEQMKIASFLSSIDDLINAQSQKIETLKLHKKGLLQGLFPTISIEE